MTTTEQKLCASAFIVHEGKVLLVKRADHETSFAGMFEIPGGHVEYGESFEVGLQREVKEETGLEVEIGEPYYAVSYISPYSGRHIGEVHYLARPIDASPTITLDPDEHSAFAWVSLEEAGQYQLDEFTTATLKKGFGLLKKDML